MPPRTSPAPTSPSMAAGQRPDQRASCRKRTNFSYKSPRQPVSRDLKIVMALEIEPKLRLHVEKSPQAQRGVGRNGTSAMDNFVDAPRRNASGMRQPILGNAHGNQKFLAQNLARMNE